MGEDSEGFVYCIKCPENGRTGDLREKIPKTEYPTGLWTGPKCQGTDYGLPIKNFVYTRIKNMGSEDEGSKFVFRELLQNADDVKSTMLILRFEEDALYVANDGRQFTTTDSKKPTDPPCDFTRIREILARYQEEDPETVGHFGSGFQTVFMITFSPEIHSSGNHKKLDIFQGKLVDANAERNSPYFQQGKGVLFRFPWRTRKEYEESKENQDWKIWDRSERRSFFEALTKYIHQAIICCQHLNMIRLIWHETGNYEGFQVLRDFTLRNDELTTLRSSNKVSLKVGRIERETWHDEWNDSFQRESWHFTPDSSSFRYLLGRSNVNKDGKSVFLVKDGGSQRVITDKLPNNVKLLKRTDVFVVLPLFDVTTVFDCDGQAYLYSVIPLPGRGKNRFIFSAHFWPTEDRKDVDVEDAHGDWYRAIMLTVLGLYDWLFWSLMQEVHNLEVPNEERQKIILNNVPNSRLSEWMRPSKERNEPWIGISGELFNSLRKNLWTRKILFSKSDWTKPTDAVWAREKIEKEAYEKLGAETFSEDFLHHPHVKSSFEDLLNERESNDIRFLRLLNSFTAYNGNAAGKLFYNQNLRNGKKLDKESVYTLIKYCILNEHVQSSIREGAAVVPGADAVLRTLKEYPALPKELSFLGPFLPKPMTIHPEFQSEDLEKTLQKQGNKVEPNEVLKMIDKMVKQDPLRFSDLNSEDHRIISHTLIFIVEKLEWTPSDLVASFMFVPFKKGNQISVGTLNTAKDQHGHITLIRGEHIGEKYERDFIFGVSNKEVPGLTSEVEAKIKFFCLQDYSEETSKNIEEALNLVKLMPRNTPTNFIRHFLSPKEPGSLFIDEILRNFLDIKNDEVDYQKKQFLEALKEYFTPRNKDEGRWENYLSAKSMSKVPCLYDEEEAWHSAGEFALSVEPELNFLGIRSLHQDFQTWEKETLLDLGVKEAPDAQIIADRLKILVESKEAHRKDICSLIYYILSSEVKIENEFKELGNSSWIPTTKGGFGKPEEIVFPTIENKRALGEDFEGFLDMSLFLSKLIAKKISVPQVESRAKSIGLQLNPSLPLLVSAVIQKRKQGKLLPKEFFDLLNKKVIEDETRSHDLIHGKDIGYCNSNRWIKSGLIRLIDKKHLDKIPKELQTVLFIWEANHPHKSYLLMDGASNHILAKDFLENMAQGKLQLTLDIWDEINHEADELDKSQDTTKYGEKPIYPLGDEKVCPINILCVDKIEDQESFTEGRIEKISIVNYDHVRGHINALTKLGARKTSEMSNLDIIGLIKKFNSENLDAEKACRALRLMMRIEKLGQPWARNINELLWPVMKGSSFTWVTPKRAYIRDDPRWRYFEKELCFIFSEVDGRRYPELEEFAVSCGAKSFQSNLQEIGNPKFLDTELDETSTSFVKEAKNILNKKFNHVPESSFRWLSIAEVRKTENIQIRYRIENLEENYEADITTIKGPVSNKVFVISGNKDKETQKEAIVNEIVKGCVGQGFPEKEKENLSYFLLQLIHRNQTKWSELVPAYKPTVQIPMAPEELTEINLGFGLSKEEYMVIDSEMNQGGWKETRDALQAKYGCCQICNDRTPYDENNPYLTSEGVKRIVCERGGRYKGLTQGFSEENSVFLCPTHHTLWFRGLVKFEFLEEPSMGNIEKVKQKIKSLEEMIRANCGEEIQSLDCYTFTAKSSKGARSKQPFDWEYKTIYFTTEHAIGFLKTMSEYLENKKRELDTLEHHF